MAEHVRSRILSGRLLPGRKLNVTDFVDELGVSQTPTREAFQLLASEGLVRIHAYRGAHVAELSADEYEEIFLMRLGLEELAAKLGAERITDDEIEQARQEFEAMVAAADGGDVEAFVRADRAFHRVHYQASRRASLWDRIVNLRSAAERYIRLGYRLPGVDMHATVANHSRLLEAIAARDGDQARAEISADLRQTFGEVYRELCREAASALAPE